MDTKRHRRSSNLQFAISLPCLRSTVYRLPLLLCLAALSAPAHAADRLAAVRNQMVDDVIIGQGVTNKRVIEVMRHVPRHEFMSRDREKAYFDMAVPIGEGQTISPPFVVASMTEHLDPQPGDKVLEIGTGSGYNAAVLAHITGPAGQVITIDIDPALVRRARASLAAAGYPQVQARCADGGFGAPADAPFDRVIVTAGAWDIAPAWLDQLGPGGRLVLPLAVRGLQLSVSLHRAGSPGPGGHWAADSVFRCGFVRMAGAFADPVPFRPLGTSWFAQADGDEPVDPAALGAALDGPVTEVLTGVAATGADDLGDLDLWLTLTRPDLGRLAVIAAPAAGLPPLGGLTCGTTAADLGVAVVAGPEEISVRGWGPRGPGLADELAASAADWAAIGRPGAATLRLTAWPASGPLPPAEPGHLVLARPHVRLVTGWPA